MTENYLDHFDDLDAWDADDYDSADEAIHNITNDIVFRPPEPPPPPAAIAAWWTDRRNRPRVAPSDARTLSHEIARHLATMHLRNIIRPNANNSRTHEAMHDLTEEIAEQMLNHAPDDLERLEAEITSAEDPPCHSIAEHLNECLNQIAALSPTDVRTGAVDAADAWRETLE